MNDTHQSINGLLPPPKEDVEKHRFNFELPRPLFERLTAESKNLGKPAAEVVRHVLDRVLPEIQKEAA